VTDIAATLGASSRPSSAVRAGRYVKDHLIFVYMALAIGYLMLPVAVMALFSFNNPPGKSNVAWHEFSLEAWLNPFGVPGLAGRREDQHPRRVHLDDRRDRPRTLIALALVRYNFRGSGVTNGLIFLPMATPEIVLGASLLTMFVAIGRQPFFPTKLRDDPDRPHHVQHQLCRRDRPGPVVRL
jgi:spermidine/putrescine transport system permease protein